MGFLVVGGAVAAPADAPAVRAGWVLGVDEAGRGSVVGPLVVGAFLTPAHQTAALPLLDVRDSKLLSPARREAAYDRLPSIGVCHHVVLSPSEIDGAVAHGKLNDLEARAFGQLIAATRPEVAYVDACDVVAARFGRMVARYARCATRIIARHHADRDFPVVGAASIVAKVLRDRAVEELHTELGRDIGSGYPSDPTTRSLVAEVLGRGERPPWLRVTWQTSQALLPAGIPGALDRF